MRQLLSNLVCGFSLALLVAGCAGPRPEVDWMNGGNELVWPSAPEVARIRYLRSISISDIGTRDEGGRFFRWLAGESKDFLPLGMPYAVAADGRGTVWVSDTENGIIHKIDLGRNTLEQWRAIGGIYLQAPIGLAFDPQRGCLLVADAGLRRVLIADTGGNLLGELRPSEQFGRPVGIALDAASRVYVADAQKGVVEMFSPEGKALKRIGSLLNPDGLFNVPLDVAVTKSAQVMVNDSLNFRIEIVASDGASIGSIGGIGDTPGSFARPRGIALDSVGHLYVVDAAFGNVQIFDAQGILLLYFGSWGAGAGEFSLPAGICIDQDDRIYVVDSYNHRIQVFQLLKPN